MAFSENDQKLPKITYTASRTGCHICQAPTLQSELSEIENLLCLDFISLYLWFCYVLSLKAFDITV